jgi:hypothetical protein
MPNYTVVSSKLSGPIPCADGLTASAHLVARLKPTDDAAADPMR